jgi:hypothetical protein
VSFESEPPFQVNAVATKHSLLTSFMQLDGEIITVELSQEALTLNMSREPPVGAHDAEDATLSARCLLIDPPRFFLKCFELFRCQCTQLGESGGLGVARKNHLRAFQIRGQFEVFGLLTQLLALLMGRQMRGVPCIGKVALTLVAVALPLVAAKRADTGALGLRQVCRL